MTIKKYNYCLDFIKGIACIFVVFMHCEFPGKFGIAVQAISRFCVPFFFMVSGYFCFRPILHGNEDHTMAFGKCNSLMIKRKVTHIGKITLYASLFYLIFVLFLQLVFHNQDFSINKLSILKWMVFNAPVVVAGQYWFLYALLYAYIFYWVLERFTLRKYAYILAAVLFFVYVVLAQVVHLAGYGIPNMIYRNWLVEAFPFFMLGHWIHDNQDRISISNNALISIVVVTTLLCLVERWFMGRDFGVNIVTIPQVFAMFVYGVKNPTRHKGVIQRLGRDCSMMVYILHPAIWHTIEGVYYQTGLTNNIVALYFMPIFVLGFSIIFSLLFNVIKAKFNDLQLDTGQ